MNPSQQDDAPRSLTERWRSEANILAGVAAAFATFSEVTLLRKNFGCRYFQGMRSFFAFLLVPLFSLFWQGHDLRALYALWLLFIVRCAYHKSVARRTEARCLRQGLPLGHSLYNGVPIAWRTFPRLDEITVKRKAEPALLLFFGLCSLTFSAPLGWFFVWCALGLYVHTALIDQYDRQQALDVLDAALDSERVAARVRDRRGSHAGTFRSKS